MDAFQRISFTVASFSRTPLFHLCACIKSSAGADAGNLVGSRSCLRLPLPSSRDQLALLCASQWFRGTNAQPLFDLLQRLGLALFGFLLSSIVRLHAPQLVREKRHLKPRDLGWTKGFWLVGSDCETVGRDARQAGPGAIASYTDGCISFSCKHDVVRFASVTPAAYRRHPSRRLHFLRQGPRRVPSPLLVANRKHSRCHSTPIPLCRKRLLSGVGLGFGR